MECAIKSTKCGEHNEPNEDDNDDVKKTIHEADAAQRGVFDVFVAGEIQDRHFSFDCRLSAKFSSLS